MPSPSLTRNPPTAASRDAELDAIFKQAGIGIVLIQLPTLRIHRANPAFAEMLGYTAAEVTALTLAELSPPEDMAREAALAADVVAGGRSRFQLRKRYFRKDGSTMVGRVTATVVRDAAGASLYGIGMVEDVTEWERVAAQLRESEARLQQAQKMEALGRVAGGIAHDFNNLLTGILCGCQSALAAMAPDAPGREDQEDALRTADRAAQVTRQLLAFSRQQALRPEPVLLDAFLADAASTLRRVLPPHVELALALAAPDAVVVVDPGQLTQVVLNLVLNAADAMPDGGTVHVSSAVGPSAIDGEPAVALAVRDTGTGMSAPVQARLFEPFFTTKPPGRGTGFGLATVYGIVAQSGGRIEVESAPGAGSTFTVVLPTAGRPGPPSGDHAPRGATVPGGA